jgi:ribosomal protein S27E
MKINCLHCGHKVDVGDAYDDYRGQVKCFVCAGVLLIKTTRGALRSVTALRRDPHLSGEDVSRPAAGEGHHRQSTPREPVLTVSE